MRPSDASCISGNAYELDILYRLASCRRSELNHSPIAVGIRASTANVEIMSRLISEVIKEMSRIRKCCSRTLTESSFIELNF